MFHELNFQGVKVPDGFDITAEGYAILCAAQAWMLASRRRMPVATEPSTEVDGVTLRSL